MKSLRKIVIKKDIEIKALKAKVDILEDDLEKYRALGLESIETMLSQWADVWNIEFKVPTQVSTYSSSEINLKVREPERSSHI